MATSMVDVARFRESFTASRAVTFPLIVLAMDQMAPLSLAVLTDLPVEMTFWVVARLICVEAKFCRATSAPAFVLML